MTRLTPTPFRITIGEYTLLCIPDGISSYHDQYSAHAHLVDELDLSSDAPAACWLGIQRAGDDWPFLVIAQRYHPEASVQPGVLLIPQAQQLFIGAGARLLAYNLKQVSRLWEDTADCGFWFWHQHGDYVLMAAELELAAWTLQGRKVWTTFVEPPWSYTYADGVIHLDVMGTPSSFTISDGPV
jgi:hypothetical protein